MYSIVMMTALTAAPDAPQFNGYFRDLVRGNSCNGCSGGCSGAAAYPTSCTGCCGSSCNGGHVFGLGVGDRVRSWFQRDNTGCCGSYSYGCTGSAYSCSGCSGSAYSCFGGPAMSFTPGCRARAGCRSRPRRRSTRSPARRARRASPGRSPTPRRA